MLKKDALIKEIREYLSIVQSYISLANRQKLFDINRLSEDLFGGLINIIENINLINLNISKMDFPAIDLGDKDNRICYQVTSENEFTKIKESLNKFNKYELYKDYDKIKILIIGVKRKYKTKNITYSKFNFSVDENVIDLGDLLIRISSLDLRSIEKILMYLESNFNKSILMKISKLSIDKSLLKEEEIIDEYPFSYYSYGTGKVRIDAYLPSKISDKVSCLFTFGQDDISGCMITLDEEILKEQFFKDCEKDITERRFIAYVEENKVCVDFPNNRFITDMETANHIMLLADKLKHNYEQKKSKIIDIVGGDNFSKDSNGRYEMIEMPKKIWRMLCDFAMKHDCFIGESEWDIFNPQHGYYNIMIYKNQKDTSFKGDIIVNLNSKKLDEENIKVLWDAGYTNSLRENEGFNNKQKWKVDYTHDWLINKFIPYVLYLKYEEERTLFTQRLNFDEYKRQLKFKDFGIKSLKKMDSNSI